MAEAQLQPLIMKEQNILDPSLSPTAPITPTISVGVQQQTIIVPRTLNPSQPTTERNSIPSTTQSQEHLMQHPAMTIQGAIFEQSMVKPPVETPDMPIPPEPPPSQVANTYLNAGVTPEGYLPILKCCECVTPQELLQEKFK